MDSITPPWPTDRRPEDIGWLHVQRPRSWRYRVASPVWWLADKLNVLAAWIDG